jgi:RNA polymerase sigma-70 factor, ECF subfamily
VNAEQWERMVDAQTPATVADEQSSLVARAADGDADAFTTLVAQHHADMLRLAGAIGGDPDLARDAVQNAWQRAWIGLRQLRDRNRVRSWLLSISANECRQLLRRRKPTQAVPDCLIAGLADPAQHVDNLDLNTALDRLDPRDRELLALRYVLGYSSVELAPHFARSPEAVRGRLKRLVDRLRTELTDA